MISSLAGQVVTMSNAQQILGRLDRIAKLRPRDASIIREEQEVITELFLASALPEGRPAFIPLAPQPKPSIQYKNWHFLYAALTNRKPSSEAHKAKIHAPFHQFYFLEPHGALTMGLTLYRSRPLPKAEQQKLLALGKARLAPQVATLADLEDVLK